MNKQTVYDVVVVGCGPTGIASLVKCRTRGLLAVGIEAGHNPLFSISEYPDGLIFSSRADHFQISDIPLDCAQINQLSKEEVLHYFARIINLYKLNILCTHCLIDMVRKKDHLEVVCKTPEGERSVLAKRAIFTAWFQPRNNVLKEVDPATVVKIVNSYQNPIEFAGKRVAIVGGGVSAREAAIYLMMSGNPIVYIIRGLKNGPHLRQEFCDLIRHTDSIFIEDVNQTRVLGNHLELRTSSGIKKIICDVLILCAGQTVNTQVLDLLRKINVLHLKELHQIRQISRYSRSLRRNGKLSDQVSLKWPDLHRQFAEGVNGVHLAGGLLHIGSSSAGVKTSIYTAEKVVDIINKKVPAEFFKRPLPNFLLKLDLEANKKYDFDSIRYLRPYRIKSRTRNLFSLESEENRFGKSQVREESNYYLGKSDDPRIKKILELSDGRNSIESIMLKICRTEDEIAQVQNIFYNLFYNNGLTWLVPKMSRPKSRRMDQ